MSAGIVGQRARPHRRRAGKASAATPRPTPIAVTGVLVGDDNVIVEFDAPVLLRGVPRYALADGTLPLRAEPAGPRSVVLTYATPPSLALVIPFEDPAVRNSRGGFVNAGRTVLPAAAASAAEDREPVTMARAA